MNKVDNKRILLAEDNELNAEIVLTILSEAGYVCEHVLNGHEAVEAVDSHPENYYDLILMDIQMPVLDGYKATRKIRQLGEEKSKIPVVALTASVLEDDKYDAYIAGMNGHISKPIDAAKLLNALSDLL